MNFFLCAVLIVLLLSEVIASQAFLCKEASLSCPVITRNHRRLKGFTLKTFHFASLISCGLLCQRDPRCVSTNFRKVSKTEGTCELNDRGVFPLEEGKELEYDEEAIYTQLYVKKHNCQVFKEEFKVVSYRCPVPLGMENGVITDAQINASSMHNYKHGSQNARLHFKGDPLTHVSAGWAARLLDTKQWLQVDLQHITRVIGIATQGRHDTDQWVTEYKLQYGDDGQTYSVYSRSGDTSETVFPGNTDRDTVVYHDLYPVIYARFVRVLPMKWSLHIAMRMELYSYSCQNE